MAKLYEIVGYLDELLGLDTAPGDASNNGLQVEGGPEVNKILFAVDASLTLFKTAARERTDMLFVHHGISWGGNPKRFTGLDGERLRTLFQNNISLYAMHLPLDAHPDYGHNACLAGMLQLQDTAMFARYCGIEIGVIGRLPQALSPSQIAAKFGELLGGTPRVFGDATRRVNTVGIISGGAGYEGIDEAIRRGVDCFVTGEVGHSSYHLIEESGMPVIALGHYISEKPGVLKTMELIKTNFAVETEFIDIPTGL